MSAVSERLQPTISFLRFLAENLVVWFFFLKFADEITIQAKDDDGSVSQLPIGGTELFRAHR